MTPQTLRRIVPLDHDTYSRYAPRSILRHFDRGELLRALPTAAAYRLDDPNVSDEEREAVQHLLSGRRA